MKRFAHVPAPLQRFRWEAVISLMLLLIALTIIGQTYYLHQQDKQLAADTARVDQAREQDRIQNDNELKAQANCLRDSVVEITDALNARLSPAEIERQATRDLILGALKAPTQAEAEQLAKDYRHALKVADDLRKQNPVPDYPDGLCDEAGSE